LKAKVDFDVLIVGGGLAGLVNAIHLSKENKRVLLIEKNEYPKHKVCGEYISNEVLPYLKSLNVHPFELGAQKITKFLLSTPKNKTIEADLPLGGFGISRYIFDCALSKKATANGATIIKDTVVNIQFVKDKFEVSTKTSQEWTAKIVIGAYGKRANLDTKMNRAFMKRKSPFLAVKIHVKGDFPNDLVALHNFEGGYCGVSKVESDTINLCYITSFETFKKYKDIDDFQEQVVFKNKFLKTVFKKSTVQFEAPLTISQISFSKKKPVENHILMCGDTAGMIHPLCGNGMGMAIRSAQIASNLITKYLNGSITSRIALERAYSKSWNTAFKGRIRTGHFIASLFRMKYFSEILLIGLKRVPSFMPKIIKRTHGKPMIVS